MTGDEHRPIRYERSRLVRFLMQALWPAFAAAALTSGLVFSALDPSALTLFGEPVAQRREGVYTAGFLVLWVLYTGACGITWWITRNDAQRAMRRQLRRAVPAAVPADGPALGSIAGTAAGPERA